MRKLNFFSDREQQIQDRFQSARDRFFAPMLRPLAPLRLSPNLLSAIGAAMLVPAVCVYGALPWLTVLLLVAYLFFDGIDGPYARMTNQSGASGAVVDMCCDHLGMLVVATMMAADGAAGWTIAIAYMVLYTLLVGLVVLQRSRGVPVQPIFRGKYYLFGYVLLHGVFDLPGTGHLMLVCSIQMLGYITWGLARLIRPPSADAQARANRARGELVAFWLILLIPLAVLPWGSFLLAWLR